MTDNNVKDVKIGIIGGSGLYHFDHLRTIKKIVCETVSNFTIHQFLQIQNILKEYLFIAMGIS
jgi:hypothetical protein